MLDLLNDTTAAEETTDEELSTGEKLWWIKRILHFLKLIFKFIF